MDYLPNRFDDLGELVGDVLTEARKPRVKKPDVPLSKKQIDIHYDDLYLGYIKKLSEIERRLKTSDRKKANHTYSEFRELKKEALYALNAVILHEGYFENLKKNKRPTYVDEQLTKSFGSVSKWEDDFIACGLASRGWTILGYDRKNNKFQNIIIDAHDGGSWGIEPILILDVYEHAFYIEYGSNKGKYIEFFMNHIDWDCISGRLTDLEESK